MHITDHKLWGVFNYFSNPKLGLQKVTFRHNFDHIKAQNTANIENVVKSNPELAQIQFKPPTPDSSGGLGCLIRPCNPIKRADPVSTQHAHDKLERSMNEQTLQVLCLLKRLKLHLLISKRCMTLHKRYSSSLQRFLNAATSKKKILMVAL